VAAAEGRVARVEHTSRGGNLVWLRDRRGYALYYAHLDRQYVREGDQVQPGDTIGFVGNTGNAITTPPHLHFEVYRRGEGPLDPWWFLHSPAREAPRLVADTTLPGTWTPACNRTPPNPRSSGGGARGLHRRGGAGSRPAPWGCARAAGGGRRAAQVGHHDSARPRTSCSGESA
jgi:murein DD-endopeptidase MepM/ murein hydrolase activator NlpD